MKALKEIVQYVETDNSTGTLSILEPNYSSVSEEGILPIQLNTKHFHLEDHRIKSVMNKETIADIMAMHGIDSRAMVKNAIDDEADFNLEKKIYEMLEESGRNNYRSEWSKTRWFIYNWLGYYPKVRILASESSPGSLLKHIHIAGSKIANKTRAGGADFIIVSQSIGLLLSDLSQFTFSTEEVTNFIENGASIRQIGVLAGRYKVLINPLLSNDIDQTIIIIGASTKEGQEGIYHVTMRPTYDEIENENFATLRNEIMTVRSQRMATIKTNNADFKYITIPLTKSRHNLITHLYKRIFKKK